MKKIPVYLFVLLVAFSSCSKDDNYDCTARKYRVSQTGDISSSIYRQWSTYIRRDNQLDDYIVQEQKLLKETQAENEWFVVGCDKK